LPLRWGRKGGRLPSPRDRAVRHPGLFVEATEPVMAVVTTPDNTETVARFEPTPDRSSAVPYANTDD
jgi:hypothetical protein